MVTSSVDKYTELYTDIDSWNRINGHFNNNRGASLDMDAQVRQVIADRHQITVSNDNRNKIKVGTWVVGPTYPIPSRKSDKCHPINGQIILDYAIPEETIPDVSK